MAVPSPVGDVKIVSPISNFVLNTLTLKKKSAFLFLMLNRSERVNTIVKDMTPMDPTHQSDRFHVQLEREEVVMDVVMDEEQFDFFENQL